MKPALCVGSFIVAIALLSGAARAQTPQPGEPPTSQPVNISPLVHEADLDAPPQKVWDVFTTDEGFRLLGPAKAKIDLRVGGKIQSHYNPAGVLGDEGTVENTIIAFEPQRMLAFRISKPPKGFPFMEAYKTTWSVATITDLGGGRSHLRLAGMGYTADEESQKMRRFFEQGNAWVMDKLKSNLSGKAPPAPAGADAGPAASDPLSPIVCELAIGAMPEQVWRCLTTTEGLKAIVPDAKAELVVGGPYELYFGKDAPAGQRGSEGCTVLSYEPMKMLSFSWNAPPKFPYARAQHTWVVVHIEPRGPHSARVTLKHMGFAEQAAKSPEHAEEWKQVRAYFDNAWPHLLGAVKEELEKPR